jgi:hypothetical protein
MCNNYVSYKAKRFPLSIIRATTEVKVRKLTKCIRVES